MRTNRTGSIKPTHNGESAHSCPRCGSSIPAYPHYSAWCDVCDWNLQPSSYDESSQTFLEKLNHQIGVFADEYLFTRVTSARENFTSLTFAQSVALLFSAVVFTFYGFLIWGGINLISSGLSSNIVFGASLLLATLWVIYPRFDSPPEQFVLTDKGAFPMLNRIVERVAVALNAPVPKVMLTEQFTATFAQVGWRRDAVLGLGHPFLALLESEEMVSLLAHELSHSQDGAITRSPFVRQALQSTRRWQRLIMPIRWFSNVQPNSFLHHLLTGVTWVLLPLTLPAMFFEFVLRVCSLQDSQRAEYVADASSVTVAGTRHTLSLLRKSYFQHLAALRIGYSRALPAFKFDQVHADLAEIPRREIDRIWRIAQRQPAQLTGTHPSLSKRIAFLQSLPPQEPLVTITEDEFEQLRAELTAWPVVIRTRENDWRHASEATASAETSEQIPLPAAAD